MTDDTKSKKERVIHTRVPESLDDEIKRRATDLGLSVSNLVRNVLQHTFGLVDDIVHDSAEIARSARGAKSAFTGRPAQPRPRRRRPRCSAGTRRCSTSTPSATPATRSCRRGTRAGVGIVHGGGAIPIRCQSCLEELAHDEPGPSDD